MLSQLHTSSDTECRLASLTNVFMLIGLTWYRKSLASRVVFHFRVVFHCSAKIVL